MTFHEIVKKMNQLLGSGGKNSALMEQQLNQRSIQFLVDLCFKITEGFDGHVKAEMLQKCNQLVNNIQHKFSNKYEKKYFLSLRIELIVSVETS